jgi:hypothetical protein
MSGLLLPLLLVAVVAAGGAVAAFYEKRWRRGGAWLTVSVLALGAAAFLLHSWNQVILRVNARFPDRQDAAATTTTTTAPAPAPARPVLRYRYQPPLAPATSAGSDAEWATTQEMLLDVPVGSQTPRPTGDPRAFVRSVRITAASETTQPATGPAERRDR